MRRTLLINYARRGLHLLGVPTLVAVVTIKAATLSAHLPFGGGESGIAVLGTPYLYPVWLVLGIGATYALARALLYHAHVARRAFFSALTLSALITVSVLSIDIGCGVTLRRQADNNPDMDIPSYAYLAAESTRFGEDNTLTDLVQSTERACAVYNIPFGGAKAEGYGLTPTDEPVAYHTDGAFGKAQYTDNGLLAEGYVFSLDVALRILETYYLSRTTLDNYLAAYNAALGTSYEDAEAALDAIREAATIAKLRYCAEEPQMANGTDNGGTLGDNMRQNAQNALSDAQIHALLEAIVEDMGNSTLLASVAPLLALSDGVPLPHLLAYLLGEETAAQLVERFDLSDVRLTVREDPLSIRLAGGIYRGGVDIPLRAPLDETQLFLAAEGGYPLSQRLSALLGTLYRYTPADEAPLFSFYAATVSDELASVASVFCFLKAAADYDFALYEGNLHGKAVSAQLIGDTVGDGTHTQDEGLTALEEVRALRWRLAYLTPILSLLLARNALLLWGGVAVAVTALADMLCARAAVRQKYKPPRRKRKRNRPPVLSAICLVLSVIVGWSVVWGIKPAVRTHSYGQLDVAAMAASPSDFRQSIQAEEERFVLYALLSGAIDPALAYDTLSAKQEGAFVNPHLRALYQAAREGALSIGNGAQARLYALLWRYYVLPDAAYRLSLTEEKEKERRAVCLALSAYLYPTWQAYSKKGVRYNGDTPLDGLFKQRYQMAVEEGYAPLADSDALYLVLNDRPSLSALLHLALDKPDSALSASDIYGEPIAVAEWDIRDLQASLADFPALLDELSAMASEDLALPRTHRALESAAGGSPRLIFVVEEGRLTLWLYPSAYREGGVGYLSGTLIRYQIPLYVLAYSMPLAYFGLFLAPFWAVLFSVTTQAAPRRPRRAPKPPRTPPSPPLGA